jgi:hypothetical protein
MEMKSRILANDDCRDRGGVPRILLLPNSRYFIKGCTKRRRAILRTLLLPR